MANRSLGQLTIDLIAKTFGFEAGMDKAARKAKSSSKEIEDGFTKAFNGIAKSVAGFVAGVASVEAAFAGFNNAVNAADRVDELSARFDISTEKLSAWGYAAKLTGGDLESLAGVIPKFSKNVADAADASSEIGKVFAALGVSVKDADGGLRTFEDLLPEIADKFQSLDDTTTETALAMQLFGRSGAEFLEFLNLGSEGLQTMEQRARDLGIVIDTETAAKAAQFKDRVDDLRAATQGWFTQIAAELLPTLTDLTNELTDFVKEGGDAVTIAQSIASSIRDIADAIRFLGSLGDVFDRIRGGLAGLELQGNAAFQSLNPANWNPEDLSRLQEQYNKGSQYVEEGWKKMQEAQEKGRRAFEDDGKRRVRGGQLQGASSRSSFIDQALQDRLADFFSGGDKPDKKTGKSNAEKEAEALIRAYDSLAASLDQQISLMGEVTKEAEVRYEVEFGGLVNLDPKLKNYLIYKAQEYDEKKALLDQQKEEKRLYDEEQKRIEKSLQLGKDILADLQFENELLGLSNREREKAITLRQLEAEGMQAYGPAIADEIDRIHDGMEQIELMDGFRDGFSNFFQDVISGTESVSDAFKNMLDDINRMILQRIADNWVEQLFGAFGSTQTGSAGGGWMSWFAGLFGGGRANGGWAAANTMYEVNERGLEMATVGGRDYLLTGNQPAYITPNHRMGGVNQTVNFVVQGRIDQRTQDQVAFDVGRQTQVAMRRNG